MNQQVLDEFKTEHNLDFEVAPYHLPVDEINHWQRFRVGTCEGVWCSAETSYKIFAIINESPGNGHLTDVLQWFENSCKCDNKNLEILEFFINPEFKKHLIKKRGFRPYGNNDVIKSFRNRKKQPCHSK